MYLLTKWFGTFLIDKKEIKEYILFEKSPKIISKKIEQIKNNKILIEEKKIIKNNKVIVKEKRLKPIGEYKPNDLFFKKFKIHYLDYGYDIELLQKATVLNAIKIINIQLSSEDQTIIQYVNALDDMIKISNLLSERLEACFLF